MATIGMAASCTRPAPPAFRVGEKPLFFQPAQIRALKVEYLLPQEAALTLTLTRGEKGWRIHSGLDSAADSIFVEHLLDVLKDLAVTEVLAEGAAPPSGLNPPAVRLSAESMDRRYDLEVSAPGPDGESYARVNHPEKGTPVLVKIRGVAPRMLLDHVREIDWRLKRLSAWPLDDIVEFQLRRPNHPRYYAQRQSGGWADRHGMPLPESTYGWLERTLGAQIKTFVDDAPTNRRLRGRRSPKEPEIELVLADRQGKTTSLRYRRVPGEGLWASATDRGDIGFWMDETLWKHLLAAPSPASP
ncbi:MAG: hypothetical protein AB7F66_00985 [Bacteriovoracia bacterium]